MSEASTGFAGSYVSLDCPDGDIELVVRDDHSCTIEKKWWDSTAHKHTKTLKREGSWSAERDILVVRLPGLEMRYRRKEDNKLAIGNVSAIIPGLEFVDRSGDDLFDRIALLEKTQLDGFFLKSVGAAKKP
jgi:hypothetical protein